jgi:serine/threonine-protein kinase
LPTDPQRLPSDDLAGRTIGSYRVERLLGKGGMGSVYLGVHPVIGSRVAIKFLHPHYNTDARIVDRFYNEARAVNLIGHDNILKILDLSVTEDGLHYFVMEFLQGNELQDLLKDKRPVPMEVAGPILLQVCDALEAAHQKGIVHRDLKPDNVYLIELNGKKNVVKVVDFGIARLTEGDGSSSARTATGMVMGTPSYMSPEQGSGATDQIDGRSDVYSLGVIMFELAAGQVPFQGENFGEMLVAHLQHSVPCLRELNPQVPEEYERIVRRCLEKAREHRFQSMRDLKAAISACLDDLCIDKNVPSAEPQPPPAGTRAKASSRPSAPRPPASFVTSPTAVDATEVLAGKPHLRAAAASAVAAAVVVATFAMIGRASTSRTERSASSALPSSTAPSSAPPAAGAVGKRETAAEHVTVAAQVETAVSRQPVLASREPKTAEPSAKKRAHTEHSAAAVVKMAALAVPPSATVVPALDPQPSPPTAHSRSEPKKNVRDGLIDLDEN